MPTAIERPLPPLPDRLSLRAVATLAKNAVDAAAGTIKGVSLLTADREAAGHGVWIDRRTLDTFKAQLDGRPLKAYATHGSWCMDGTLDEVGLWQNPQIDETGGAPQLREDFFALDAWKKHCAAEFDTLFELATKAPTEFGASLSFRFSLVWVNADSSEVPTVRKFRYSSDRGYEQFFEPPATATALRAMPSVRATEVYSADFVDDPAANDGLFRAGTSVDGPAKGVFPVTLPPTAFAMLKDLYAKFSANPALLAAAIKLHTENEKLTLSEIVGKVEGEAKDTELTQLRASALTAKADLDAFATLKQTVSTEEAKLTAAGFKAADGKTLVDLALAALKEANDALATFRKDGGAARVNIPTTPDGKTASEMKRADWSKLPAKDQTKFILGGGILTD